MIKNPVRRSVALALLFLMLASMCLWAESVPTTQDLDVLMLFTSSDEYRAGYNYSDEYKSSDKTLSKTLYEDNTQARVLTAAVYLCVDATKNDQATTKIKESHTMIDSYIKKRTKIMGLKYTVDEIIRDGDSGPTHEKYTHMGWHYYEEQLKNQKDAAVCWYKRRYILQQAVNVLFKFNPIDEWISLQQCKILMKCADKGKSLDSINIISRAFIFSGKDEHGKDEYRDTKSGSLAALFYYTHILGDIIDNKESSADTRMSISGVQKELKKHLYNLFGEESIGGAGRTI